MLDHVFLGVIGAVRRAFEGGEMPLLERQAFEERFQVDMLLGDQTWETSYSLPGESMPPQVRADLTLDWSTWSQSSYRSWTIGEPSEDPPEILIEVVFRVQRLAEAPSLQTVLGVLPEESAPIGPDVLERAGPSLEEVYDRELHVAERAVEVSYEGMYRFDDTALADRATVDAHFEAMGRWVASSLIRLGDLKLDFLPPEDDRI
jgi:hypothetical protein